MQKMLEVRRDQRGNLPRLISQGKEVKWQE